MFGDRGGGDEAQLDLRVQRRKQRSVSFDSRFTGWHHRKHHR